MGRKYEKNVKNLVLVYPIFGIVSILTVLLGPFCQIMIFIDKYRVIIYSNMDYLSKDELSAFL